MGRLFPIVAYSDFNFKTNARDALLSHLISITSATPSGNPRSVVGVKCPRRAADALRPAAAGAALTLCCVRSKEAYPY